MGIKAVAIAAAFSAVVGFSAYAAPVVPSEPAVSQSTFTLIRHHDHHHGYWHHQGCWHHHHHHFWHHGPLGVFRLAPWNWGHHYHHHHHQCWR